MSKKSFTKLFIPIILILIPLVFFYKTVVFQQVPFPGDLLVGNYEPYKSDANMGVVPHKGQGADVVRELYPWKYYSIDLLKQGIFPLWNPYTFSGTPHFANLQSGALYPVNILFFVMPFIPAWSMYIFLQFIFLILFTYLYLREIKLRKLASIFGAVSFSFSGFITVWAWYGNLGHTLAFLPLVLYSIEKIFTKPRPVWFVLLIISLVLAIFAGYIQFVMYMYLLSVAYTVAKFISSGRKNSKAFVLILLSFGIAALISAVQLLPVFELVSLSLRSTYSYQVLLERLMPPESVITLLVPDFFGNPATLNYFLRGGSSLERAVNIGLWPLLFAFLALFSKKQFARNFYAISSLVIFLSVLSIPPVAYFHSIGIPFLSTGIPTRALSIFGFCFSVLGAIGVHEFLSNGIKIKKVIKVFVVMSIIFAALWTATFILKDPHMLISRRNLIIPSMILIAGMFFFLLRQKKIYVVSFLLLLTISELFYSFQKFNSFVPSEYLYPASGVTQSLRKIQGIDRFWGYGGANIDANFQLIEKNYTTAGYDALFSKRYGEFTASSKNGKIPLEVPRSVADIVGGYGVNDLKENPNRKRALDLTGVKYLLNKKGDKGIDSAFDEKDYKLISERSGWQIYENRNSVPRIALFGEYKVVPDKNKIISTLYDATFDPGKTIILEEEPVGVSPKEDATAKITLQSYTANNIHLATASKYDQLLFISDNYFPGWSATVDGVDAPIYRGNYTFRAIPVKAGKHTVLLSYFPDSFKWGIVISVASTACLILVTMFVTIKSRVRK